MVAALLIASGCQSEQSASTTPVASEAHDPLETKALVSTSKSINPSLKVSDYQNQTYFFRRTLVDIPAQLDDALPMGINGGIETVNFIFESDRVLVRRATPLGYAPGSTTVDLPIFLRFPVTYKKADQPTTYDDPQAVATLGWQGGEFQPHGSALYIYLGSPCLTNASPVKLEESSENLSAGTLSILQSTSYAENPQCLEFKPQENQTEFSFLEKFSFLKKTSTSKPAAAALPFEAQNLLGFGLFVSDLAKPSAFGNLDKKSDYRSVPRIFDLEYGKTVTYILSGLPAKDSYRDKIVAASQKVFKDLNLQFQALLHRSDEIFKLEVDLDSQSRRKNLGELGKNNIFYERKHTASGLLGIGLSEENPENGRVLSSSVFLFGGNLEGGYEDMLAIQKARLDFQKKLSDDSPAAAWDDSEIFLKPKLSSQSPLPLDQPIDPRSFRDLVLPNFAGVSGNLNAKVDDFIGGSGHDRSGFLSTLNQAIGRGVTNDHDQLLSLTQPQSTSAHQRLFNSVAQKMRAQGDCLLDGSETWATTAASLKNLPTSPEQLEESMVETYEKILRHELLHTLGLRHNFKASYDLQNFKFNSREQTDRNSSSVMDYIRPLQWKVDGFGPQDIATFRAGYGGEIELAPKALAKTIVKEGKAYLPGLDGKSQFEVRDKRYIALEDYRRALSLKSWNEFTAAKRNLIPVKKYAYCSDTDTLFDPLCNRFDLGTTPMQIVENGIERYRSLYPLSNFENDKIRFNWWSQAAYQTHIIEDFAQIRKFLEQIFYLRASSSPTNSEIISTAMAAKRGLDFFQSVIRTPDAPDTLTDPSQRFLRVGSGSGQSVLVERRWLSDRSKAESNTDLLSRGVEFDKLAAMVFLTSDRMPSLLSFRYGYSVSYLDLEKAISGKEMKAEDLSTIRLLREIILDQITPTYELSPQKALDLSGDARFHTAATPMMRFLALSIGGGYLDQNSITDEKENLSRLFRVYSSFEKPKDAIAISAPGVDPNDLRERKFFAGPDATVALEITTQAKQLAALLKFKNEMKAIFKRYLDLKLSTPKLTQASLQNLFTETATQVKWWSDLYQLNEKIAAEGGFVDLVPKDRAELPKAIQLFLRMFSERILALNAMKDDRPKFESAVEQDSDILDNITKKHPIFEAVREAYGLALSERPEFENLEPDLLPEIANLQRGSRSSLLVRFGMVERLSELMNSVFATLHPELNTDRRGYR